MKSYLIKNFLGRHLAFLGFTLAFVLATHGNATAVLLDLRDPAMMGLPPAGAALDSTGTFSISGLTITATAAGGDVNALTSSLGVDTPSAVGSDDSDQIEFDFSESLTFVLSFAGATSVTLTEIDFAGIGAAGAGDGAFVNVAGTGFLLETGAAGFSGSSDVWTPPGGISLNSGDTIVFSAESVAGASFGLQTITFDIVPEPAMGISAMLGILLVFSRRRARRSAA